MTGVELTVNSLSWEKDIDVNVMRQPDFVMRLCHCQRQMQNFGQVSLLSWPGFIGRELSRETRERLGNYILDLDNLP